MNESSCSHPSPLTDADLLMALDDQANPEVTMHLSQCPACQERARRLSGLQHALTSSLYRIDCPAPLELGEYQMGLLPAGQSVMIARHASICPHCAQEIVTLLGFMAQPEPLAQPSPLETARARLRVLVAELTGGARSMLVSPGLAPAFAGLRGDDDGPLTYEAGDAQIILEIQDDEQRRNRKAIVGLVMGLEDQHATAHLWREQQPVNSVAVDALGNFVLDNLAPGCYELFITGESDEIHMQELPV
jgi:hypothetical protein